MLRDYDNEYVDERNYWHVEPIGQITYKEFLNEKWWDRLKIIKFLNMTSKNGS